MAVVLRPSGALVPLGASDDRAHDLQAIERALGGGPESDAAELGSASSPDLLAETRWPVYVARARELGFRTVEAARAGDDPSAVATLWSGARLVPGTAGAAAVVLAEMLASSTALEAAETERAELRRGLDTRALIGEAVGIMMERLRLTEDAAFGVLREVSQRRNTKVRDVAGQLVRTGELLLDEAEPARAEAREGRPPPS
jgi:hypothetical protein